MQRYLDLISLDVLLSMGGAAFLQTSKGSVFDPFASGVLLQLRHLSSFLYIIYIANFTRGQKGTSLNKGLVWLIPFNPLDWVNQVMVQFPLLFIHSY